MRLEIDGLEETITAMQGIQEGLPDEIADGLKATIAPIYKAIITYPAQRSGSRYKRTGYYGRSTTMQVEGSGVETVAYVTSTAPYADYVRGDLDTGYPGRDGWESLQSIVDRLLPDALDELQQQIDEFIEGELE